MRVVRKIDITANNAYVVAMAVLNIRNLPEDVHARLRVRAAEAGRSMEAEAREILTTVCRLVSYSVPEPPAILLSQHAPEPVGLYPHARRVGNLLFLSGIGPRIRGRREIPGVTLDEKGEVLDYDIEVQCRSVFENVRRVLEEAGSSWDRLVDVTVFLTNIKRDFDTYNRVYAEYFRTNPPCRTTVEVNRLPTPIAIELKCIATID